MTDTKVQTVWLNDKAYNFLKFLAMIALPALATLYFALAQVWGLGFGNEVVGTIVAVDTFLGVVLGISSAQYSASDGGYDGTMHVEEQENGVKTFNMELDGHPEELLNKSAVTFKINATKELPPIPGDLPSVPPTTA